MTWGVRQQRFHVRIHRFSAARLIVHLNSPNITADNMVKSTLILSLAALSTAFVIPDEAAFQEIQVETHRGQQSALDSLQSARKHVDSSSEKVEATLENLFEKVHHSVDNAITYAEDTVHSVNDEAQECYSHAQGWIDTASEQVQEAHSLSTLGFEDDSRPGHDDHGHHGHNKPNMTVYQLIASSKYTTKLAKLVNDYPDLVDALNGTAANYTVFAPTDNAFKKIPEGAPKPSKEQLKDILLYHVSADFYPAGRVLVTRTIPSLLKSDYVGPRKGLPQRLSTNVGLRGLTVNFYSRIIAINIFGTNGVIHGVDSLIIPPPAVLDIIEYLPSDFSTLELALLKTGLKESLNTTHHGGTFFAPSNFAFQKLGPGINAFLFSPRGQKYLKALLEYHVVPENTLYSDAFYSDEDEDSKGPPRGQYHYNLPTMLEDRSLSVDIGRYGRLIEIKINGFARVAVSDGVAKDGVIQDVSSVLIPPKGSAGDDQEGTDEQEMSVEELMSRLEPFVSSEDQVMMDL
ncbi:MAG: hypothetical protein M1828_002600 [Chrysothrix sp. TS-e1954]|nr:MAG: hypothetical protein M1828_002600 [Chrysothrix sp. TS-e1954]